MKFGVTLNLKNTLTNNSLIKYRILVFLLIVLEYWLCNLFNVFTNDYIEPLGFYISLIFLLLSIIFLAITNYNKSLKPKNILFLTITDIVITYLIVKYTGYAASPFYILFFILLLNINILYEHTATLYFSIIILAIYTLLIYQAKINYIRFKLSDEIFKLSIMGIFIISFEWARSFKSTTENLNIRIAEGNRKLQEVNRLLDYQKKKLDEKNKHYMEMLGFVSHELKNPLVSIISLSELFKKEKMSNEDMKQAADYITSNAQNIRIKVDKYLSLAKIEKGELELDISGCELVRDIIEPSILELEQLAQQHNMNIKLNTNIDVLRFMTDPELFKVVLNNLIGNAVKYGKHGTLITVNAHTLDDDILRVEIINSGEGIPEDMFDKVFEKFERLKTNKNKVGGTGLGLFNTKIIIEKLEGKIWCESQINNSTKFIFELPLYYEDERRDNQYEI